jgi:CheY-like chemotaxis protein
LRVLVIEDNVDAAETLKDVLELNDHQVALAFAGAAGVEKARLFRPDIVLCDIGLPGMDGYAVARALREDPALRRVGLVALTGYAMSQDRERAKSAGFDRHLPKPPDLFALERIITELARTADTPLTDTACPASATSFP